MVQVSLEPTPPAPAAAPFRFIPPPPGPLDRLDPAQIPAAERFPWQPKELVVESRLGEDTIRELSERGHDVVDAGPWALGRLSAVSHDHATGILKAAANPRGMQGYAVGR